MDSTGNIVDDKSGFDKYPNSVAYGADVKLYIGKYMYRKWKDDSVRPHCNDIRSAREQQGIGKYNKRYHAKKKEQLDL